jgi:hypothetical protein
MQFLTKTNITLGVAGIISVIALSVGFGLGGADGGFIAMGSIAGVLAFIIAIFAIQRLPASVNSGSSIGVLSFAARSGEFITSMFISLVPISLIWLGVLLSALAGNLHFILPSLFAGVTVLLIAGLQSALPQN